MNRFRFKNGTKIKDNSRFELPHEIDLLPFTEEFKKSNRKSQKKMLYSLKGIVVHSGTIHGGHYFSFIKNEYNQWLVYNDASVQRVSE